MADEHDCGCQYHPDDEGVMIVSELRIVKHMNPDGSIVTTDMSNDGGEGQLEPAQYFEMAEWARAFALAPMVASIIAAECFEDDEDN